MKKQESIGWVKRMMHLLVGLHWGAEAEKVGPVVIGPECQSQKLALNFTERRNKSMYITYTERGTNHR